MTEVRLEGLEAMGLANRRRAMRQCDIIRRNAENADESKSALKQIEDSEKKFIIQPLEQKGEGNSFAPDDPEAASSPERGGSGGTIYNPDNRRDPVDDSGSTDRGPVVGFTHELDHAKQSDDGTNAPDTDKQYLPAITGSGPFTPSNEIYPLRLTLEEM